MEKLERPPSEGRFQLITVVRENWLTRKPHALSGLIAALVTLCLAIGSIFYWNDVMNAFSFMAANYNKVFVQGEYWRAWTTLFVHGDAKHLLSNSFLFFILGILLVGYFGTWMFPIMAFFFGGIVNFLVLPTLGAETNLVGASGVVFWMGGVWLTLYALIERRKTPFQRALRSFGVALAMFVPSETFDPQISYRSHFYGFAFGVLWALIYYAMMRKKFEAAEVKETTIEEVD